MLILREREPTVPEAMRTFGIDNMQLSSDDLKRRYRALSMQHHPDVNPGADPQRMAGINAAYDVLKRNFGRSVPHEAPRPSSRPTSSRNSRHLSLRDIEAALHRYSSYVSFFNGSMHLYPFTKATKLYVTVQLHLNDDPPSCTFFDVIGVGRSGSVSRSELNLESLRVTISLESLSRLVSVATTLNEQAWSLTKSQKSDAGRMMPIIRQEILTVFSR